MPGGTFAVSFLFSGLNAAGAIGAVPLDATEGGFGEAEGGVEGLFAAAAGAPGATEAGVAGFGAAEEGGT